MVKFSSAIDHPESTKKVYATNASSTAAIAANVPVHLYRNNSGTLLAAAAIVDANSVKGKWGVTPAAISSGGQGFVITEGAVTLVSGGTAGQLITSIAADGTITDATAASANTDLALGVSTNSDAAIIY